MGDSEAEMQGRLGRISQKHCLHPVLLVPGKMGREKRVLLPPIQPVRYTSHELTQTVPMGRPNENRPQGRRKKGNGRDPPEVNIQM